MTEGDAVGIASDLWRFPVKSFAGERLRKAFFGPFGVLGDRRCAAIDEKGQVLSARRVSGLLGFAASYTDEAATVLQITTPSGQVVTPEDPSISEELWPLLDGPGQIAYASAGVHDVAPVHLLSTASLAELGRRVGDDEIDRRRFRANLIVEVADGEAFTETSWIGKSLQVGQSGPVLHVISPTERCAVTTFDPETLERNPEVHRTIANERENFFGAYAIVAAPGWVSIGDEMTVTEASEEALAASPLRGDEISP